MTLDPYTAHRDHALGILDDLPPALPNLADRIALAQVHATLALATAAPDEVANIAELGHWLAEHDQQVAERERKRIAFVCDQHIASVTYQHGIAPSEGGWDEGYIAAMEIAARVARADAPTAPEVVEDRQPYEGPQFDLVMDGHDLSLAPHYPGPGRWCEACPIPGTEFGPTGPGMG